MTAPARAAELMSAVASLLLRVLIHGQVANGLADSEDGFAYVSFPRQSQGD
jgi:hypothetical protein